MKQKIAAFTRRVKQEVQIYQIVIKDERTPWLARLLIGTAVSYLLLPFDLIPDAIPILGQLDDLLIVPALIYLGLKLIPENVLAEAKQTVAPDQML